MCIINKGKVTSNELPTCMNRTKKQRNKKTAHAVTRATGIDVTTYVFIHGASTLK